MENHVTLIPYKHPHWITLNEEGKYILQDLFNRIGFNTTTHTMNGDERLYSTTSSVAALPEPPNSKNIEFYLHRIYNETDGYINTTHRAIYHIQTRILRRYFNLLYLAHISTSRLAEQDLLMDHIKELLNANI